MSGIISITEHLDAIDAKNAEIERLQRELAEARALADQIRVAALNADWHDFDALIAKLRNGG